MIKYFSKAFKITNENIILTTPLVLFLLLLSIYLGIAKNAPETLASAILLIITIWFMFSAFHAGWFFMVKKAIDLNKKEFIIEEDKAKASFALIKEVPVGIGEYFLSFAGWQILYLGLLLLLLFIGYQIGLHFIGKIGLDLEQVKLAFSSPETMKAMVTSLTKTQLIKLNEWYLLLMATLTVFSFIPMFWPAQIIMKNKNPFIAFFQSLYFLFKNFWASIILFIYILFINFFVFLISFIAQINVILYFLSILISFYFFVYVVVLVFLYYDSEQDKMCAEKTESSCNCGPDSSGEESVGDTKSEGD